MAGPTSSDEVSHRETKRPPSAGVFVGLLEIGSTGKGVPNQRRPSVDRVIGSLTELSPIGEARKGENE